MNTITQDVAVFIDFENIYVSVREKFDATPNFEALMEKCEDYGRVVVARAYADWYRYPRITSALFANNIEPMYVPTYYYDKDEGRQGRPIKNSVDMHMCIDAMRTLYTRTNIAKYVFITGDRDFIALVNCVRQEGKDVIIIGIGGAASSHLAQSADEFLFYEQIVDIRPMGHQHNRRFERPERLERPERPERSNGRDERRRERPAPQQQPAPQLSERPAPAPQQQPAPVPQQPVAPQQPAPQLSERPERLVEPPLPTAINSPIVASNDNAIYDTLVEALRLARKRGYVPSFGSLKVLMKELMPNFKENRYRDSENRPFAKFTDFVREAERRGKIQIFASGTVNEVFLPDEDPYKLSQFAEDLPSVEAERELEQELAAEAEIQESAEELTADAAATDERGERSGRRRRRRGAAPTRPEEEPILGEPTLAEDEGALEEPLTFGEREWALFYRVMQAYSEPVPFADIFNDLRELRNSEELDLTNNALKELIKQAINEQRLQRSNRGAKAHYRLLSADESAAPSEGDEQLEGLAAPEADEPTLPDLSEDDGLDLPDLLDDEAPSVSPAEPTYEAPEETLPDPEEPSAVPLLAAPQEAQADLVAVPAAPATEAPKPAAKRRRKKADEQEAQPEAPAPEAEAPKPATKRRRKKLSTDLTGGEGGDIGGID